MSKWRLVALMGALFVPLACGAGLLTGCIGLAVAGLALCLAARKKK